MELHGELQIKDTELLKLTQTMSSMLSRLESLQTQIVGLEMQAPPHSEPMSPSGFAIADSDIVAL